MKTTPSLSDRLQFLALGPRDWIVRLVCVHEYAETLQPEIRLYRVGEGPFASDSSRIKQARFLKAT